MWYPDMEEKKLDHWKFELWFDAERIKEDIRILNYAERFKIAKKLFIHIQMHR